jgi:hypothetical protein
MKIANIILPFKTLVSRQRYTQFYRHLPKQKREIQILWLSELHTQKIKLGSKSQQLVLCAKRSRQRFVAKAKVKTVTETIKVYWGREALRHPSRGPVNMQA